MFCVAWCHGGAVWFQAFDKEIADFWHQSCVLGGHGANAVAFLGQPQCKQKV